MRRDFLTIIVGILFLLAGIAIGGNMLDLFHFTINLSGWWTVFIIVPALFAIAQGGLNAGNVVMLSVGVILLMNAQGILPRWFTWRLIFPLALLVLGFRLLFGDREKRGRKNRDAPRDDMSGSAEGGWSRGKNKSGGVFTEASKSGASYKTASAMFGGQDIVYGREEFTGGSYTAVFGGLTINLANVTLSGDAVINASAIFGAIDLILPSGVAVISHVSPVLGSAEVKYASSSDPEARKIIVNGTAMFGGVMIK